MIKILFTGLVLHAEVHPTFEKLLDLLSSADQRKVLLMVLKFISTKYLSSVDADEAIEDYPTIWAAASALQAVIGTSSVRKAQLVAWLSGATGAGLGETCGIRRAALAVLADDKEAMFSVLESSLGLLGDQLYIKHAPMLQQEGQFSGHFTAMQGKYLHDKHSTCPGTSAQRRLRASQIAYQTKRFASLKQFPKYYLQQDRRFPG